MTDSFVQSEAPERHLLSPLIMRQEGDNDLAEDEIEEIGQISEATESSSPRTKGSSFSSLLWKEDDPRELLTSGEPHSEDNSGLKA